MPDINISVKNKIATKTDATVYVCGNSDFTVRFDFDAEWSEYEAKTARFVCKGKPPIDVVFEGDTAAVPIIEDTYSFTVGVFAGNLHTTTPAYVPCKKSILCGSGSPAAPVPDVYAQIMELLQKAGTVDPETVAAAVSDYLAEHPVTPDALIGTTETVTPTEVKEALEAGRAVWITNTSKILGITATMSFNYFLAYEGLPGVASCGIFEFNGFPVSAQLLGRTYDDSWDVNANILAQEGDIPSALPNPHALTLTGAVNATYDGSEPVKVEIPATYSKEQIDAALGAYITDVDTLIGGDA